MGVFDRKRYKGGRDGQHRKDIQRNEKQGKDIEEYLRRRQEGGIAIGLGHGIFLLFI